MLNNSGESGYPCLVPDLSGNAFGFSFRGSPGKNTEISLLQRIFQKPVSLVSPALTGRFITTSATWEALKSNSRDCTNWATGKVSNSVWKWLSYNLTQHSQSQHYWHLGSNIALAKKFIWVFVTSYGKTCRLHLANPVLLCLGGVVYPVQLAASQSSTH